MSTEVITTSSPQSTEASCRPEAGWRCYHCDEHFYDRNLAAEHFGSCDSDTPACQIAASERGLVGLIREQEEELRKHRAEETPMALLYYRIGSDHRSALIKAEQEGYDKGLADGRALSQVCTPAQAGHEGEAKGKGVSPEER